MSKPIDYSTRCYRSVGSGRCKQTPVNRFERLNTKEVKLTCASHKSNIAAYTRIYKILPLVDYSVIEI